MSFITCDVCLTRLLPNKVCAIDKISITLLYAKNTVVFTGKRSTLDLDLTCLMITDISRLPDLFNYGSKLMVSVLKLLLLKIGSGPPAKNGDQYPRLSHRWRQSTRLSSCLYLDKNSFQYQIS